MAGASDKKEKVPYAKYAFANPYNLSLLAGAAAVAAATGNWAMGIAAAGAEAIWMLFAPDSRILRKVWFDKKHAALRSEEEKQKLAQMIAQLPDADRARCETLAERKRQIDELAAANPTFTVELLSGELAKLDSLKQSFIDMMVTCNRYTEYLRTIDLGALEADIRRYSNIVDHGDKQDDERRQLALKNLDVLQRRKGKMAEIRQYIFTAKSQLDLIENTFQLLADQIVTMRSPTELSGQLDQLLDGVEAVRQTTRETDKLLQQIER